MLLGGAAVIHGVDQWQRGLPLCQVVADILAEFFGRRVVIERVVDQLERESEMTAETDERLFALLIELSQDRADTGSCLEELRRFAVDDFHVVRFGNIRVVAVHELQNFPLGDRVRRIREDVQNPESAEFHHHLKRSRVEEITDEHACLIAEGCVRRLLAAAEARIIHDIVMEEGSCVDNLDDRGSLEMPPAFVAAGPSCQERSQRP